MKKERLLLIIFFSKVSISPFRFKKHLHHQQYSVTPADHHVS